MHAYLCTCQVSKQGNIFFFDSLNRFFFQETKAEIHMCQYHELWMRLCIMKFHDKSPNLWCLGADYEKHATESLQ